MYEHIIILDLDVLLIRGQGYPTVFFLPQMIFALSLKTGFSMGFEPWPQGYKTFFMLNSTKQEIYPAHKC